MKTVSSILKVSTPAEHTFATPGRQSMEETEDFAVKKNIATKEATIEKLNLTGDNETADTTYVPNVLFNTDATPPAANTVPRGTIYIQYTA